MPVLVTIRCMKSIYGPALCFPGRWGVGLVVSCHRGWVSSPYRTHPTYRQNLMCAEKRERERTEKKEARVRVEDRRTLL